MISWRDVTAMEQRHQDLLRRAEQARLLEQALAKRDRPGLWPGLVALVSKMGQKPQASRHVARGARSRA